MFRPHVLIPILFSLRWIENTECNHFFGEPSSPHLGAVGAASRAVFALRLLLQFLLLITFEFFAYTLVSCLFVQMAAPRPELVPTDRRDMLACAPKGDQVLADFWSGRARSAPGHGWPGACPQGGGVSAQGGAAAGAAQREQEAEFMEMGPAAQACGCSGFACQRQTGSAADEPMKDIAMLIAPRMEPDARQVVHRSGGVMHRPSVLFRRGGPYERPGENASEQHGAYKRSRHEQLPVPLSEKPVQAQPKPKGKCPCLLPACSFSTSNLAALAAHIANEHAAEAAELNPEFLKSMQLSRCASCRGLVPGLKCLRLECVRARAKPGGPIPDIDRNPLPVMSLDSVCKAQWATMQRVPHAVLEQWAAVFLDELRAYTVNPTEVSLLRLFLTTKLILAVPFHGGKTKAAATERIVARQIERWNAGQTEQMWLDMSDAWCKRHKNRRPKSSDQSQELAFRRAAALVKVGLPGRACRQLCSRGVVDSDDILEQLGKLFPSTSEDLAAETTPTTIEDDQLCRILRSVPRGLAPGPSGLRTDHIIQLRDHKKGKLFDEFVALMIGFAQQAVSGSFPKPLARWLCAGRAIPLKKKGGGIRPLVVGETLRAVVSKYILLRCGGCAREVLPAVQLG